MGAALRGGAIPRQLIVATGTAILLCVIIRGWDPPFGFVSNFALKRDVVAVAPFSFESKEETREAERRAVWAVPHAYQNDSEPLIRLRENLRNDLLSALAAENYESLDQESWMAFFSEADWQRLTPEEKEIQYDLLRASLEGDAELGRFAEEVTTAMAPFEKRGLLAKLEHRPDEGSQEFITVLIAQDESGPVVVRVADVLIGDGSAVEQRLRERLVSEDLTARVFAWIRPRLPTTLSHDPAATRKLEDQAVSAVEPVVLEFERGQTLILAGESLSANDIELLRAEYNAILASRTVGQKLLRATVVTLLILGLFVLTAVFMMRHDPPVTHDFRHLLRLSILIVSCVGCVRIAYAFVPNAGLVELVPVLLLSLIITIAYRRELALLLTGIVAFVVVMALGQGIAELTILMGTSGVMIMQLTHVRSRSKLVLLACVAGLASVLLTLVVDVLWLQEIGRMSVMRALMNGLWTVTAGFLMTGLLPFIERPFGILTDVSLLELTDASHPLLHELVRRAPATYSHSILVGSIGERAAEAIGARGLLVRVGAYFHDIGKIMKPAYFYENQSPGDNRHAALVPQMSTLLIIAHVKDGVDLARQHKLPQPIIDLVEQHHGTTLVQYFYGLASEQFRQAAPESNVALEESTYRYPGPKPQTKEAGILMLADASESACRSLSEPSPQRIESLIRNVAKQKLQDGQFDESGLTLRELRIIEDTIISALIANYHGRIKYQKQQEEERQEAEQQAAQQVK